ncbi:hypothetical protein RCL1_008772 [Eukaryota sp. TZLM3-RCL]
MVQRLLDLLPRVDALFTQVSEISDLIPSRTEIALTRSIYLKYKELNIVTKKLQLSHVPLHRVKAIFEAITEELPEMTYYTSYPSEIMHSPDFELAVVKILTNNESSLTERESLTVACFLLPQEVEHHSCGPFQPIFRK